jgi:hypothetical protein
MKNINNYSIDEIITKTIGIILENLGLTGDEEALKEIVVLELERKGGQR